MAYLLPNSVFIHIPKTAGQWIASALDNAGLITDKLGVVHSSIDEIEHDAAYQERAFVFTFVRHPLTWYQSMWAHRMDEQWTPMDDPDWFSPAWMVRWAEFTDNCQSNRFEDFVRNCVTHFPDGFVSSLFDTYVSGCTYVGKQEQLISDLPAALDQAGEKYDLEKLLKTKPRNVRGRKPRRQRDSAYSSDLVQLIMNTEIFAIEKFGYHEIPPEILSTISL